MSWPVSSGQKLSIKQEHYIVTITELMRTQKVPSSHMLNIVSLTVPHWSWQQKPVKSSRAWVSLCIYPTCSLCPTCLWDSRVSWWVEQHVTSFYKKRRKYASNWSVSELSKPTGCWLVCFLNWLNKMLEWSSNLITIFTWEGKAWISCCLGCHNSGLAEYDF